MLVARVEQKDLSVLVANIVSKYLNVTAKFLVEACRRIAHHIIFPHLRKKAEMLVVSSTIYNVNGE